MISAIIARLYQDLKIRIVKANQIAPTPPLPYGVYNITSPYIKGVGQPDINAFQDSTGLYIKRKEQYLTTISFNIYAATNDEAMTKAIQIRNWFDLQGYYELQDQNLVVANLGNVENRTTFLVDSYEYKFGFDIQLRATSEDLQQIDWIEFVELEMEE